MSAISVIFGGLNYDGLGANFSAYGYAGGYVYFPLGGQPQGGNPYEEEVQFTVNTGWTLKNFGVLVTINHYTTTASFNSRINEDNGNITISIGDVLPGWVEDTSHSDSLVSGELVDLAFAASPDVDASVTIGTYSAVIHGSQNSYLCGSPSEQGDGGPPFASAFGLNVENQTESAAGYYVGAPGTASSLSGTITINGRDATFYIQSRINGANGNEIVSIPSGSSIGNYQDTSHLDSWDGGSLVDTEWSDVNNSFDLTLMSYQLAASTTGVSDVGVTNSITEASATTYYASIGGYSNIAWNVEADMQVYPPRSATLSLFRSLATVVSNSITATVRVNGSNGNGAITIAGTGWTVDASHTDSVTSADPLDYEFVIGSGSGTFISQTGMTANYNPSLSH